MGVYEELLRARCPRAIDITATTACMHARSHRQGKFRATCKNTCTYSTPSFQKQRSKAAADAACERLTSHLATSTDSTCSSSFHELRCVA